MTTDGDGRANRGIPLLDGAPEREQSGKEAPAGDHVTTTGNQSALGLLRRTGSAPQTTAVVTYCATQKWETAEVILSCKV